MPALGLRCSLAGALLLQYFKRFLAETYLPSPQHFEPSHEIRLLITDVPGGGKAKRCHAARGAADVVARGRRWSPAGGAGGGGVELVVALELTGSEAGVFYKTPDFSYVTLNHKP